MEYVTERERQLVAEEMRHYADEMGDLSREMLEWSSEEVRRMLEEHTEW
ncbi:MAG: hypothetical protein AB1758_24185 [Candidatus Eremiobacterota bacterium]